MHRHINVLRWQRACVMRFMQAKLKKKNRFCHQIPLPGVWSNCPSPGGSCIKNVRHTYALSMCGSYVRARRPQPHPVQFLLQEGVFWASWLGITPQVATSSDDVLSIVSPVDAYLRKSRGSPPWVGLQFIFLGFFPNYGDSEVRTGFAHRSAVRCPFAKQKVIGIWVLCVVSGRVFGFLLRALCRASEPAPAYDHGPGWRGEKSLSA